MELTEWMAFSTLEPFGADADYIGHAITASTVANSTISVVKSNGSKTAQKPFKTSDFMPKFEKQEQTTDHMLQVAEMFTAGLGGQDLREDTNG